MRWRSRNGARDGARLIDGAAAGSQPGGQHLAGHAVERDSREHPALLVAEVLFDGPAQRGRELVPRGALPGREPEAAGKPVPAAVVSLLPGCLVAAGTRPPPPPRPPRPPPPCPPRRAPAAPPAR